MKLEKMTIAAGILLVILLSKGVFMTVRKPRGIRNNNPGNIEYNGTAWQGLDNPPHDGRYCRFITPEHGIRAMARVLSNYQELHGINTVQGIIHRWAPPHENDTGSYVRHVAQVIGVHEQAPINVREHLPQLVKVITQHENGQQPYSDQQISDGIKMAFV